MKKIFQNYFLELILAILLALQFFLDLGLIVQNKWLIFFTGLTFIIVSVLLKIKDDNKFKELVSGFLEAGKSEKERTDQLIKEVREGKEKAEEKVVSLEEQNILIARLIKEGLINEKSIYQIIQKYKFYSLFCYQNVPEQEKVQKIMGVSFRNPSLEAVESIGFVKVGTRHNLYVIPHDYLTDILRNPLALEKAVRQLVIEHWVDFLEKLKQKNETFAEKYIENNPDPANCTYMISVSNFHDVIIGNIGWNSFSREFKNLLQYHVNIKKLKKEISKRKYDINRFVRSISYDLFLVDISKEDKEKFIEKEEEIKNNLSVANFTDYRSKKSDLKIELKKYFSERKSAKYAELISEKSMKYYELFSTLGIDFN